jgi:SAM-dependent methyltransferase
MNNCISNSSFYILRPVQERGYYDDPERYEAEVAPFHADLSWYIKRVQELGQPVLELGCGSGRLLFMLAANNIESDGLDNSVNMLARAKTRAVLLGPTIGNRVNLYQKDMRSFALRRHYRVVLAPFNALMHLHTDEDFLACLRCVKRHLEESGTFIFDVSNPQQALLNTIGEQQPVEQRSIRIRGLSYLQRERHLYNPATGLSVTTYTFEPEGHDEAAFSTSLSLRMYTPSHLEELLQSASFVIINRYGDFSNNPLADSSVVQVVEAKYEPSNRH